MTGIIRRGGRPNKVTKPASMAQPRRAANGGGSSGGGGGSGSGVNGSSSGHGGSDSPLAAAAMARRQQAISEQLQLHYDAAVLMSSTVADATDPSGKPIADAALSGDPDGSADAAATTLKFDYAAGRGSSSGAEPNGEAEGHSHGDGHSGRDGLDETDTGAYVPADNNGDGGHGVVDSEMLDLHEADTAMPDSSHGGQPTPDDEGTETRDDDDDDVDIDLTAAAAAAAAAVAATEAAAASHSARGSHENHENQTGPPDPPGASGQTDRATGHVGSPTTTALLMSASADQDRTAAGTTTTTTTEQMALRSGYTRLLIESALAKRLAREPALRPAQQRRPEQQLNLARRSNVEALFAHIAGDATAVPCKNCHKGHGPWTACVVVDGQMCGSCANCWFNASGSRCSFHETKTPLQAVHPRHAASPPMPIDPHLTHPAAAFGIDGSLGSLGLAAAANARRSTAAAGWHPAATALPPAAVTASTTAAAAAAVAAAVQQLQHGSSQGSDGPDAGSGSTTTNNIFSGLGLSLASAILGEDLAGAGRDMPDAGGASASTAAAGDSSLIGYVVDQALAEVRAADRRARDLMMVEIAAKQLALAIVRYGEDESERRQQQQQQQQTQEMPSIPTQQQTGNMDHENHGSSETL